MSDLPETPESRIARPVASSSDSRLRRPEPTDPRLSVRNSSPISDAQLPATPTKQRNGRLDLASLRRNLSPRDLEILGSIAAHRFLTTAHIRSLHFSDHGSELGATRSCNRVLRRLSRDGLLIALDRRVGGIRAGSAGYIWHLSPAAHRILQLAATDTSMPRRFREPSQRLLTHTLAVANTHIALVRAAKSDALELVTVQVEPGSWRRFLGLGAQSRLLRPDLAVITAQGDYEDHWFIEVDLGTEHPPTVVRKCHLYEDYRRSGIEQDVHGLFPRVLWVVPDPMRADKLTTAITEARLDQALFRVVTAEQLIPTVLGGAA